MLISLETDFPIFKCGCFEIFHKMEQKKFWSDILLFFYRQKYTGSKV